MDQDTESVQLLDYSDSVEFYWNYAPEFEVPSDETFARERGSCLYCEQLIPIVFSDSKVHHYDGDDLGLEVRTWVCPSCGWWQVEKRRYSKYSSTYSHYNGEEERLRCAVLRRLDARWAEVPIEQLARHIKKHPAVLNEVSPAKMERLAQSIFSSYFACEVEHVGRSRDGGIDLILVKGDLPAAVQVKRRVDVKRVEPVALVREFLGAMLLNDFRRGYLVTTAGRFSGDAEAAVKHALAKGIVDQYELVSCKRFLDMLELIATEPQEPWRQYATLSFAEDFKGEVGAANTVAPADA